MQLFIGDKQYFSVEEYANAIIGLAKECREKDHLVLHAYSTDEDRINRKNAIGGFVPYKPYSTEQIRNGIMTLGRYVSA